MRKIIVSIFLVLTFFCSPAMSITAADWLNHAQALWYEEGGKFTDPKKAIEYLNNAIKLQPNYAGAYNSRGNAYADLGQYTRALEDYNEAIRLKPDYTYAYINRGDAYYSLGQYQLAIEDCNKSIRLKPDNAIAYSNRGKAYAKSGQYQPAIKDFNEAIRLKPDYINAFNNRGFAYLLQGNNNLGCRDAQKACAMGLCKLLEWARGKGQCLQEQSGKPGKDEVKNPPTEAPVSKSPEKQSPPPAESVRPSVKAEQSYKGIKGITGIELINGKVIEGQIISMNPDTVKIRTKDGNILSYDFKKEIKRLIVE
jgi:tetratricopeptide (TPR) repeat protein